MGNKGEPMSSGCSLLVNTRFCRLSRGGKKVRLVRQGRLQCPYPKFKGVFLMPSQRKPSIVFVHGLWADGSCFSKLIPALQDEGFEVIASQHGLDSHAAD